MLHLNAGPCEFLQLIHDASFVITSSFHGVAFSVNFSKPFIAIVKNNLADSRILGFLKQINLDDRAVEYNAEEFIILNSLYQYKSISNFVDNSNEYLKSILV